MKKRSIRKEKFGVTSILEASTSLGICIILLIVFFLMLNNIYNVYDNPIGDMKNKAFDISEKIINFPGLSIEYSKNWENDPIVGKIIKDFGLSELLLVEYGVYNDSIDDFFYKSKTFYGATLDTPPPCFLAGTKVVMADGSYKNIEDIIIGDFVKSFDDFNKIINSCVTNVFHHSPEEMTNYYLNINNKLRVTPNHRIYSNGLWAYANELKVGDLLFCSESDCHINSIEKIYNRQPTFDLKVGDTHNYFIAFDSAEILVHNQDSYTNNMRSYPWLPVGKDISPSEIDNFRPVGYDYHIVHVDNPHKDLVGPGNYTYHLYSNNNIQYGVLNIEKVKNFKRLYCKDVREILGLNTTDTKWYNFNIVIKTYNDISNINQTFGMFHDTYTDAVVSVTRPVLVYREPFQFPCPGEFYFKNSYYLKGTLTVYIFQGGESALCGDVNDDGTVDDDDLTYLQNYMFAEGPPPVPLCTGDINGDCSLDIADIVYLNAYINTGGPLPIDQCCGC